MEEDTKKRAAPRRMLNLEEVLKVVPVARSTLQRMVRRGLFPAGKQISPNRRVWYEDEVLQWQDDLPQAGKRQRKPKAN
jgi:prophage regulatory protein